MRFQTPEEFLVRTAAADDDWALIDEVLLPKLQEGRSRDACQRLERLSALYRCPPDEFVTEATKAAKNALPIPGQLNTGSGMTMVIDVWQDRQLDVDIFPLFQSQLRRDLGAIRNNRGPAYIDAYFRGLADRGDASIGRQGP